VRYRLDLTYGSVAGVIFIAGSNKKCLGGGTQIGIDVQRTSLGGVAFSFWLRKITEGEDWSDECPGSNYLAVAIALSILEVLSDAWVLRNTACTIAILFWWVKTWLSAI